MYKLAQGCIVPGCTFIYLGQRFEQVVCVKPLGILWSTFSSIIQPVYDLAMFANSAINLVKNLLCLDVGNSLLEGLIWNANDAVCSINARVRLNRTTRLH